MIFQIWVVISNHLLHCVCVCLHDISPTERINGKIIFCINTNGDYFQREKYHYTPQI